MTHQCLFTGRGCTSGTEEDGQPKPAVTEKPKALCPACLRSVERAVRELPEAFVQLSIAIGDKSVRPGQRVSGTRNPPVPLNVDVDAAMMGLVDWVNIAVLRIWDTVGSRDESGRLEDPPEPLSRITTEHARIVKECCHKLVSNVERLIDSEDETTQVWRRSGESTTLKDLSGADVAYELVKARRSARRLLGQTTPKQDRALPCPSCQGMTAYRHVIRKVNGTVGDVVSCESCNWSGTYEQFSFLAHGESERLERESVEQQERDELERLRQEVAALRDAQERAVAAEAKAERLERGFLAAADPAFSEMPAGDFAQIVLGETA